MTIDELRAAASATNPLTGGTVDGVTLVIPREDLPRGQTVCLDGRRGPKGRVCCVQSAEGFGVNVTAYFKAADVLAYCDEMERRAAR